MLRRLRAHAETAITGACVMFLAWFLMRFYMDTSNDSETLAYSAVLFANVFRGVAAVDATGHATLLAQYALALFDGLLQPITGGYLIRGMVVAQLAIGLLLFGAAYGWYRRLGLPWLSSLFGLNVLSICIAFARQSRGWELDKLLEPALYLLAAVALWDSRRLAFVGLAALAALNRETGVFVPLIALAYSHSDSAAKPGWPVWASALVSLAIVLAVRLFGPEPSIAPTTALASNLAPDRLVSVLGGLCLVPLFALAWVRSASPLLRRLCLLMAPPWLAWVLATDALDDGARLLGLLALVFIPLTLQAVQATLGRASVRGAVAQGAR